LRLFDENCILEPYSQYFISVRAKNKAGMGEEYHAELWTKALDGKMKRLKALF